MRGMSGLPTQVPTHAADSIASLPSEIFHLQTPLFQKIEDSLWNGTDSASCLATHKQFTYFDSILWSLRKCRSTVFLPHSRAPFELFGLRKNEIRINEMRINIIIFFNPYAFWILGLTYLALAGSILRGCFSSSSNQDFHRRKSSILPSLLFSCPIAL